MGDKTGIEWTDATWNPVRGCSRVSAGCDKCYAETHAGRFCGPGLPFAGFAKRVHGRAHWTGKVELLDEKVLGLPLRWRTPRRIFVNSMSDLFHENLDIADIAEVFNVMACATLACEHRREDQHEAECWSGPSHTFQVLTKRAPRMRQVLEALPDWVGERWPGDTPLVTAMEVGAWPLPNVWLGVSVESPEWLSRVDELRRAPASVRFISAEPLLADLGAVNLEGIDQVIVGGESGAGARPMHPNWVRSIRDQCQAAGVAFFMKQGSKANWPDFKNFDSFPADLRIREYPHAEG